MPSRYRTERRREELSKLNQLQLILELVLAVEDLTEAVEQIDCSDAAPNLSELEQQVNSLGDKIADIPEKLSELGGTLESIDDKLST